MSKPFAAPVRARLEEVSRKKATEIKAMLRQWASQGLPGAAQLIQVVPFGLSF